MPQGPDLAVVSTDIRPKDAQLHLDGRFIGRARYFDGTPGYLYLEPGKYRLELRFGGYRTDLIEIDARAGCRFSLKHRMTRQEGTPKERKSDPPGKGKPFDRAFAPQITETATVSDKASSGGPDLRLRNDLRPDGVGSSLQTTPEAASLRLVVEPPEASVYLDGSFVAIGRELGMMEGPLATTTGSHRIEVRASGYVTETRKIELKEGQVLELEVSLKSGNGAD
jgi:hypothetical protein